MRQGGSAAVLTVACAVLAGSLLLPVASSGKATDESTLTVFFAVGADADSLFGNFTSTLKGSGLVTGPGTELGADRLEPVPESGLRDTEPGFTFVDSTPLRTRRLRLTVVAARNYALSPNRGTLTLSVEVTSSDDRRCRERSAERPGVRGTVVIVRRLDAPDTVTLQLACGVRRVWEIEREKGVILDRRVGKGSPSKPKPKPPAAGAFPGGTATKMTLTIGGVSATTDLKTNRQTPGDPVLKAKSSTTLSGSVKLNGTLPKGWTIAVFHTTAEDLLLVSPTGGAFTGVKPIHTSFDAFTRPGAYVCATKVPPLCAPAAQANISIDWDP